MKWHWHISAGEFFELLRPSLLIIAALLSVWVLASARRWRFALVTALGWALGTFLLPLVVLPLYFVARRVRKHHLFERSSKPAAAELKLRWATPAAYAVALLLPLTIYLYRDHASFDAHLARAAQAKVMNQPDRAIREYEAALRIQNDAHTHKLLGIELADKQQWATALRELQAAEAGGEQDDGITYVIARALEATGRSSDAHDEFQRFLTSPACMSALPDDRCARARARLQDQPLVINKN